MSEQGDFHVVNPTPLLFRTLISLNLWLSGSLFIEAATFPIYLEPPTTVQDAPPSDIKRGTNGDAAGNSIDFNSLYYLKNGAPWLPVMGEMHYSRVPHESWGDALDKMKASGIDIVSSYVIWIHHEESEGDWDWSGNKDLGAFLDLCKQKGLFAWLRVGPWSHAEVRNGGFPDWLYKKGANLRSNDPKYLDLCKKFYAQMAQQMVGRYFKDGGPIIGIQLENEYGWHKAPAAEYMYALKKMAIESGMDVPIYSQFSPEYPADQKEFIGMLGGYVDAPWGKGTQRQVREQRYQFESVVYDPEVGSDLFGERKGTDDKKPFPSGMAEYGGGLHVSYHRRPCLFPGDIAAPAYAYVGSGANLLGYYMFHGGTNPIGKLSTLQESRKTKYPNDHQILSYDYQGPIGEWGQANEQLADLRLLHLALNDFGGLIATMKPYRPGKDTSQGFRYAVRVAGDAGCVFFNNHTRYLPSPEIPDVTFEFKSAQGGGTVWPSKPLTIRPDVYGFFPFGWKLEDLRLNWATAQPVCLIENQGQKTWVFKEIPGIVPEYDFAPDSIKEKKTDGNLMEITTRDGKPVRILTLTHAEALQAYKVRWGKGDYLVLSNAMVSLRENQIGFQLWNGRELNWKSYPALPISGKGQTTLPDHFAKGSHVFPESKVEVRAAIRGVSGSMPDDVAKMPQPGPLYGATYSSVAGATTWDLNVSRKNDQARDYLVEIDYKGDTFALYRDGVLAADDFQRGAPMRFLLNRALGKDDKASQPLVQIVPFTPDRDVYLEKPELKTDGLVPAISSIRVTPIYEIAFPLGETRKLGVSKLGVSVHFHSKYISTWSDSTR